MKTKCIDTNVKNMKTKTNLNDYLSLNVFCCIF